MKKFIALLGIAATTLFYSTVFAATGYPQHTDYVNDFAKVLTPDEVKTLVAQVSDFQTTNNAAIVIATINSIHDYQTGDQTIESFGQNLFNTWGVGDSAKNNGVLILVAVKDRKVRIQLGAGYSGTYDATMTKIIAQDMAPAFKTGQWGTGLQLGVSAVMNAVVSVNPTISAEQQRTDKMWSYAIMGGLTILLVVLVAAAISAFRSGKTGWGWTFLAAAGMVLWFIFKLLGSSKGRGFGGGRSSGGGGSGSF